MYNKTTAARRVQTSTDPTTTPSRLEHYSCALAGLGSVVLLLLVFFPVALKIAQQSHGVSTTLLIIGVAALWAILWISLESVWEWRSN